jgi:uncharacterized protein YkwD
VDKRVVIFGGLAGVGAIILLMRRESGSSEDEPVAIFTEHAPIDSPQRQPPRLRDATKLHRAGSFARDVLPATNARRAAGAICGSSSRASVPPLAWNADLAEAAQAHAVDMAIRNYFNHVSPDGGTPSERIHAAGFSGHVVGENIASGQTSVEDVMNDWMKSPGHCENIMRPEYKYLGVGYYFSQDSAYGHYWVQCFGT